MKGALAVLLALAENITEPLVDVTYLVYAKEEITIKESGLREIRQVHPELLQADAAILGEPTANTLEEGCQGVLRLEISLAGIPGSHRPLPSGSQCYPSSGETSGDTQSPSTPLGLDQGLGLP